MTLGASWAAPWAVGVIVMARLAREHAHVQLPAFPACSRLLPGGNSGPVCCIVAPFTKLTGSPVAVVFRGVPPFSAPGNPAATRLTASLESGFGYEVRVAEKLCMRVRCGWQGALGRLGRGKGARDRAQSGVRHEGVKGKRLVHNSGRYAPHLGPRLGELSRSSQKDFRP